MLPQLTHRTKAEADTALTTASQAAMSTDMLEALTVCSRPFLAAIPCGQQLTSQPRACEIFRSTASGHYTGSDWPMRCKKSTSLFGQLRRPASNVVMISR